MKKTLLALAVMGVAGAAQADTVNVTVYGRVRAAVESINGAGATTYTDSAGKTQSGKNSTSQIRIVDNYSTLGFKGSEDLGNGQSLLWQVESQFEADGDADGRLGARNTFIGLKGGWGTVLLGRYDTPYKVAGSYIRDLPQDNSTAELGALWGKGLGQDFYTRQASSIQYLSPNLDGFEVKFGYAPDESKTESKNAARWSLSASYVNSAMFSSLAYENRADTASSNTEAVSAAQFNIGAKFGLAGFVGVGFEQFKAGDAKQGNVYVSGKYKVTDTWTLGAYVGLAGKDESKAAAQQDDSKATAMSFAVQYDLSKRTNLLAYFTRISNQQYAAYNFSDNKIDQLEAGKDPRVIGFGLNHTF